jgi:hypothetical protein
MKKMILGLLFIATACLIVQSADVLPQGKWVVTQITSEKNIDGKVQTTNYNSSARFISHIPCPQELEINDKGILLRHHHGFEEFAEYTLDGDQLTIDLPAGTQKYKCEIKDDTLTLTANYKYVNNDLVAKKSEQISEKRVITFKMK